MDRAPGGATLAIDEFPYLVQVSPELPSVLQRILDTSVNKPLQFALCGSSQRMMHGLVLDQSAPLYGRAREIVKIEPLSARWIHEALGVSGTEAVEAYSIWGGVPRNWELAADCENTQEAIKSLILDRNGILHNEPPRLLLDDMRSAVQTNSILSLVGIGCHRISEIAGRLGKPVGSLTRSIKLLIDLGYVWREVPFGESPRSTKRSIYRLADPFLSFWYRFVQPSESLLELDLIDAVYARIAKAFPAHVAEIWEQMARRSVPGLNIDQIQWGPASRWWGKDRSGKPLEVDVVAESLDGYHLLVGEAKWSEKQEVRKLVSVLRKKASRLPLSGTQRVHYALWIKCPSEQSESDVSLLGPDETIGAC